MNMHQINLDAPLPDTLRQLADALRGVGERMGKVQKPAYQAHARELRSAAGIATEWANAIEHEQTDGGAKP